MFDRLAGGVDWRVLEPAHERAYGGFTDADLYPDVRPTLVDLPARLGEVDVR
ncbi:MAG: hypothetical protein KY460_09500 [Actinobacteria bacterium]|nr:hypothetical protein [Actinomycetota bacterium]